MNIIRPTVEYITPVTPELLRMIETAGRTCYKSENLAGEDSAEPFVRRLIKSGHEAMLEHASVTMRITCDRGVTHEIVRHRMASYAQESTRYCNYSKDKFGNKVTYIDLQGGIEIENKLPESQKDLVIAEWIAACDDAERHYMNMLKLGATPQIARSVLNNSTKTEIVVTMNIREIRHFLQLRTSGAAHPQMREVANQILDHFRNEVPVLVEDIQ